MLVADALRAHGGSARWSQLKGHVSRRTLQRAVSDGTVEHIGTVYSLPPAERATVLARQLRGAQSHRSAAEHWGFALPPRPDGERDLHDVAVAPDAKRAAIPQDARLHYVALDENDTADGVLTPAATAAFCLHDLSLRDALSVGDSALASRQVTLEELADRVRRFRGPGSSRALNRLAMLDARAANAFESSCRALLIEAGIRGFEPQVDIQHRGGWIGRVDLAHRLLRIVIECDGFEQHGTLDAMTASGTRDLSQRAGERCGSRGTR